MKTIIGFIFVLSSLSVFAQKSHDELIQDFLQQRKQMMEEVMKAFDDDDFFKDDFDDNGFFDQIKKQEEILNAQQVLYSIAGIS